MKRIHVQLPEDLLERIDAARGDVPLAAWVRRACEMRLDSSETRRADAAERMAAMMVEAAGGVIDVSPKTQVQGPSTLTRYEQVDGTVSFVANAPIPCQCGGVIYQAGKKVGQCSRCSSPKEA